MLVAVDDDGIALSLGNDTGTISAAKRPFSCAAAALSWLRTRKAS
jgi:hypothetical protein